MTDIEFNAICSSLGLPGLEPVRKRHTVFVGHKSVTYFENSKDAEAEVARLKACGHADAHILTTNW